MRRREGREGKEEGRERRMRLGRAGEEREGSSEEGDTDNRMGGGERQLQDLF